MKKLLIASSVVWLASTGILAQASDKATTDRYNKSCIDVTLQVPLVPPSLEMLSTGLLEWKKEWMPWLRASTKV